MEKTFVIAMRQRVVIAIALACDPELLICDEPTTALDVTIQAKIIELIQRIQKERGISVIYITHDLGIVAKVADYVNVMYAGKIVEKGTVDEIYFDPRHPYTWGLLSAMPDLDTDDSRLYTIPGSPPNLKNRIVGDAFAPRNIYALKIDERAEPPMYQISETHFASTWLLDPRAPKVEMPAELKARIARMQFGGVVAVNNLSLEVNKGEIVALIGPNGAGKTTAFNCITGVYEPTNGQIEFCGKTIVENHPRGKMAKTYAGENADKYKKTISQTPDKITQCGIARTFQNIRLFGSQTVYENVLIAKHMREQRLLMK